MKILALSAAACVIAAAPAGAAEYFTSYTGTSGTPTTASMWFTTSDVLNSHGGYDIIAARGDVNGDVITGLEANPNQPNLRLSDTRDFNYDNNIFGSGPLFDTDGAVFKTASGLEYNIWSESDATYTLHSYLLALNTQGGHDAGPGSNGILTLQSPPPPPPAPPTPPTQPIVLNFEDARTYSNNIISTHGFDFSTGGDCCAYSFGNTAGGADNHTQRIIYARYDVTMKTNDGSAFAVTGLDAGTLDNALGSPRDSLVLTGTRTDGSIVTAALDVGNAFAPYLLTDFDHLVSLTFGRPSSNGRYFTFDNLAVGPASAAPEPAVWLMMMAGLGLVGHAMRRAKTRATLA